MVNSRQSGQKVTIILTPNRSASWRQSKILLMIMTAVVFVIAATWALLGAWVILPFAGLEVGLLALFMYKVSYATYQQQIISIEEQQIAIQMGVHYPKYNTTLDRRQTHLTVTEAETSFDVMQLFLQDKRSGVPVGQFLNQPDRQLACEALQNAGVIKLSNKWWQH